MKIAVTSTNIAKLQSVENIFKAVLKTQDIEITPFDISSGVSETPINDNEAILGCRNRIDAINQKEKFDYVIAMEGLIQKYNYGTFLYGIAIIYDCNNNRESIGCSAKVQVPNKIVNLITPQKKLSDVVLELYHKSATKCISKIGTNGIITNGIFTRIDEFESALKSAIGYILNDENYK